MTHALGAPQPREQRRRPGSEGPLRGRLVRRDDLDITCRGTMFALLSDHFDGAARDVFEHDLEGKGHVILLEDARGGLQGFSTLHVYESQAAASPVTVIYSGDTIVQPEAWGSPALARAWIDAVTRLSGSVGGPSDVYWLLLSSGYRTYRFLPLFYRCFYPRWSEPTPAATQRLMHALATERFGSEYHAAQGVVRFARPQVLKPALLSVPPGRQRDPDIAFFLAANPGFVHGDELVCLTRIHEDNLTRAARRIMRHP